MKPCRFTDHEIASFMEMKTMGITNKFIAKEYKTTPCAVKSAVDRAKKRGMTDEQFRARLNMPELMRPRMGRGETGYKVK